MNIDMDKLKTKTDLDSKAYDIIDECEIKPVDCSGCYFQSNFGSCQNCSVNKQNLFKPKHNELDKLFVGAPVMKLSIHQGNEVWDCIFCQYIENLTSEHYKLPTVEEAPRNVWLAPWVDAPEELESLICWCRIKGNVDLYNYQGVLWNEVESIMILEDFKK